MAGRKLRIGVLALQGDFLEHKVALTALGIEVAEVRLPEQIDEIDGLIIPGGESTTIVQLLDIYGFRDDLIKRVRQGLPIWGTCAGMIVIANQLTDQEPDPLRLMDIEVIRNGFGRQVDSFEQYVDIREIGNELFRAVFIRAPIVKRVGKTVEVLASLDHHGPIAVRQNHILATSFHPELTNDYRVHKLFVEMVKDVL